jgi:hypothetical protein
VNVLGNARKTWSKRAPNMVKVSMCHDDGGDVRLLEAKFTKRPFQRRRMLQLARIDQNGFLAVAQYIAVVE